ncbi:hypothetical protein [Streptomyces sp. NPDC059957]|uniref:hypothetical protein n=1 Tax=unclassified Streptomyces TaxID=2593676 RepID=UPI00365A5AB4
MALPDPAARLRAAHGGSLGADARRELCDAVLRLRDNAEAAARLRVLVAHLVGLLEDGREETYAARIVMAGWVADAGTAQETLPTWRVLISDCTAALGEEHPLTLPARFRPAEQPRRSELFGADEPVTLRGRCAQAAGVAALHGEAVARPMWRELPAELTRAMGARHDLTRGVRERLGLAPESEDARAADLPGLGPAWTARAT